MGSSKVSACSSPVSQKSFLVKVAYIVFFSFFTRRGRGRFSLLLFGPLLYVSAMLICAGPFPFSTTPSLPPGSLYRSSEAFWKLWPAMQSDNGSSIELTAVWKYHKSPAGWKLCANQTSKPFYQKRVKNRILQSSELSPANGYLIVEANGGLNQQRSSICNAVAVAGLLNAILVVPELNKHSIWKDSSNFRDIYNEDHFMNTLQGHVRVVKRLPDILMERFDYNISNIPNVKVNAWSPVRYYLEAISPLLHETGVIRISPFANRLAQKVPPDIQFLRCLANYEALTFSTAIMSLTNKLIDRMKEKSSKSHGKYVSVHLRFEEDMVAFSCCQYDGGEAEKLEMEFAREIGWKGKFNREGRMIQPEMNRVNGKCPLTPLEVGMMLRGMGFDNNTSIYMASGKIYQAERNLAPLLQMFPLLQTKETLATPEELAPFEGYSSRMAALDYTVCLHSEVFVTSHGGNFPHFLMGHRRYMYNGHAMTIKPDKRKLVVLLDDPGIRWETFKANMTLMLHKSDHTGFAIRKPKGSIYGHPFPECMCRHG
ncbi:hypothetical protein AMTRI_Chr11g155700 [Amborella trichopoda]